MNGKENNYSFRVMQLVGNLDIGGAQEVVRTLSSYLTEHGCSVVVCTLKDGPLRGEIEQLGIPVEVLPGRRYSILSLPQFVGDMLRIRRGLLRLVSQYRINVIQTHLLRGLDFLVLSLKFQIRHLLVFWTIHNEQFTLRADQLPSHRWLLRPKQIAHHLLYRAASRRANGFVAVSDEVAKAILQKIRPAKDRVTVICNGVDSRRYQRTVNRAAIRSSLGLAELARLLLVVGTLKKQKGHQFLIQAVSPIIMETPDLHILFAGDGPLRETLEAQVREAGLEKHIHFLGNRQDVPDLLAASNYFVLPSLWEGLPMALIEAMASGLPVVATQVSGSQQVITHDETGILVPPGDTVALNQAIKALLADPERAREMGQAARARMEALFGAKKQAEEHMQLYQREWRRVYQNA